LRYLAWFIGWETVEIWLSFIFKGCQLTYFYLYCSSFKPSMRVLSVSFPKWGHMNSVGFIAFLRFYSPFVAP
jgi:hypothetical protein